eukprot:m.132259 g.132259  ORF g.132259 m.132259 type:complete len:306 (+) comp20058_c0_seq2:642-1559(+)
MLKLVFLLALCMNSSHGSAPCFILRSHGSNIDGVKRWMLHFGQQVTPKYPYWIVHDVSLIDDPKARELVAAQLKEIGQQAHARVWLYDAAEHIPRNYPNSTWLVNPRIGHDVRMDNSVETVRKTSWWLHSLPLISWLRSRDPSSVEPCHHSWVVEHDARYIGSVSHFLEYYDNLQRQHGHLDFISALGPTLSSMQSWNRREQTRWGKDNLGLLRFKLEHVEYYSMRYLVFLDSLLQLNVWAYGEVFESSICENLHWCKMHDLVPDGMIANDSYSWNTQISYEQWQAWQTMPEKQNRWVHCSHCSW